MSLLAKVRRSVVRNLVLRTTNFLYGTLYGMDLGRGVRISWTARLDRTNPQGVHIGDYTAITAGAALLSHDFVNRTWRDVRIGRCCFVGYGAIVLPGVTVGDHCIIAGNAVVGRDVPANSVVMGNPARVVESGIVTGEWGIRLDKGNAATIAH